MDTKSITMPRRRFGRTELAMPVFSCGGMRYQHTWSDETLSTVPPENQANLEAIIHRAVDLGINHIETAHGYGTSEIQLGQILPKMNLDKMIIQTKVSPAEDAKVFREMLEKSFKRLCLDRINLFAFHGINNQTKFDWTFRKNGCLDVVREFQKDGRIGHVGFSTHGLNQIICDTINTGELDYVNLHWYFVNNANWHAVEAARAQDMGVFIISPNSKGGLLYEAPQKLIEHCAPLTPMEFNNLFCLSRNEVHTLSIGAERPKDFDAHIESLSHFEKRHSLSEDIAQKIYISINQIMGKHWCENWRQGLPQFFDVPDNVNILEILRLFTWAKGMDMVNFAKKGYNLLGNANDWFPGEKANNINIPAISNLVQNNPFAEHIGNFLQEAHELLYDEPEKRLSES